jgi:hypothetical protein
MKQRIVLLLLAAFQIASTARADEGMWLLHMLKRINEAEMQQMGLNLSAEEIYSLNQACLRDAVITLNGGSCTAEIISDQGLVLTNHHCAYGAIQGFSTVEDDILTNGFWAMSLEEEKPIPDFSVTFLQRIEDVTERVLADVTDDMDESTREQTIQAVISQIEEEEKGINPDFRPQIKSFYHGNEFYLLVYRDYTDIRLVGNPPESIGKFGGDTDNWMWPRHTGDFSMLRIYADADNNPSDYSEDNQPYQPKRHLKVSLDGVQNGDFTMIMGYPGSTDRFLSSHGVQQALDLYNPSVVDVRDLKLKTMKKHMDADPAVRIQYAAKYAQTANYWKYYIGQSKGLRALDVYGKKKALEDEFNAWMGASPDRKKEYGAALGLLQTYYENTNASVKGQVYSLEAGLIGCDLMLFAFRVGMGAQGLFSEDADRAAGAAASLRARADGFFKDYDQETDRDLFINLMTKYMTDIPADQQPAFFATVRDKYKGDFGRYAEKMYPKSFLTDAARFEAFISNPSEKTLEKDLAVTAALSLIETYRSYFASPEQGKFDKGYRLLTAGLRAMNPDKMWYPDANSTMRLSYGTVGDYDPADAVHYDFVTTSDGILQKKDNTDPEFVVDGTLESLLRQRDFGRYADEDGDLVLCFISNNDITGGNSGSPVLNGNGDLIGLAFDGNWEAMSGDIAFESELQRTISVDIRYVMWIIDKMAGAQNLIDEIDFVTAPKTMPKDMARPIEEGRR